MTANYLKVYFIAFSTFTPFDLFRRLLTERHCRTDLNRIPQSKSKKKPDYIRLPFRLSLDQFEESRKNRSAMGLIERNSEEDVCITRAGNYSNCEFCGVTLMCTIKVNVSFIVFHLLSLLTCFRILQLAHLNNSSGHRLRKTRNTRLEVV